MNRTLNSSAVNALIKQVDEVGLVNTFTEPDQFSNVEDTKFHHLRRKFMKVSKQLQNHIKEMKIVVDKRGM